MTEAQAAQITAIVAGSYAVPAWTELQLRAFRTGIQDLDEAVAVAAVDQWRKTRRERPTIADIRESCVRLIDGGREVLDVDEAWGVVLDWISAYGRYGTLPDSPAAVRRVVDRMGWTELCNSTNPEISRAQFERFWRVDQRRHRDAIMAAPGLLPPPSNKLTRIGETLLGVVVGVTAGRSSDEAA